MALKYSPMICFFLAPLSSKLPNGRASTTSPQRLRIWQPQAWSFSYLHRAVIAIDEQAGKDCQAGRMMSALAAWQNALVFCEQLSHRTQLWPENVLLSLMYRHSE